MKIIESSEYKGILLDILIHIDKVCRENNLEYYLAYGTLLGAVRHRGFIPWDDDIDIVMKRKDYMKLIDIINKEDERYKVCSLYNDSEYNCPFAKIVDSKTLVKEVNAKEKSGLGVWVDVYALDNYDPKVMNVDLWMKYRNMYAVCNYTKFQLSDDGIIKSFKKFIGYLIFSKQNPRKFAVKMDDLSRKVHYDTELLFLDGAWVKKPQLYESKWFVNHVELDFEGYKFMAPQGYKEFLTSYYGDYMKLPPENERAPKHEINAFWK